MITRNRFAYLTFIILIAHLAFSYPAFKTSANDPPAGSGKYAVAAVEELTEKALSLGCPLDVEALRLEAAQEATKKERAVADEVLAAATASLNAKYPDNEAGKAAVEADSHAGALELAASEALKAAAEARRRACESGNAADARATEDAEKAAQEAEANADAAAAAADEAGRKADANGPQLDKKLRDARRALRAAYKRAKATICSARECVEQMDERTQADRNKKAQARMLLRTLDIDADHALYALAPQRETSRVETASGLRKFTFDTLQGEVTVNLPDDAAAGDTISGTVFTKPKGKSDEEQAKNKAGLDELVLAVDGLRFPVKQASFVWHSPKPQANSSAHYDMKLLDVARGKEMTAIIEFDSADKIIGGEWDPGSKQTHPDFLWWPVGGAGRPKEIYGPFDGYFSTTVITIGGQEVRKLAESPRKLVFESPHNITGLTDVVFREGNVEMKGEYRSVGIRLSAPTTTLPKGGSTTVTGVASGVGGSRQPIPIHVECVGQVDMQGGNSQILQAPPSSDPNATFVFNLLVRATKGPGPFTVTAIVTRGTPGALIKLDAVSAQQPQSSQSRAPSPTAQSTPTPTTPLLTNKKVTAASLEGQTIHIEGSPQPGVKGLWRIKIKTQSGATAEVFVASDQIPDLKFCNWIKVGKAHDGRFDPYIDSYEKTEDPTPKPPPAGPKPGDTKAGPPKPPPTPEPPKPPGPPLSTEPSPTRPPDVTQPETCKEGEKKTTHRVISCEVSDAVATQLGYDPTSKKIFNIGATILRIVGSGRGVGLGKLLASAFSQNYARHLYIKLKIKYVDETWVCKNGKWVLESSVPGETETGWIKLYDSQGGGGDQWLPGSTGGDVEAAINAAKAANGCP